MLKFHDTIVTKQTLVGSTNTATSGVLASIKIDATGYNRARFVFNLGTPGAGASFSASIWNAATSGGTFTAITDATLALHSSGKTSGLAVVDVAIASSYPWVYASAMLTNSYWVVAGIVDLYNGVKRASSTGGLGQIVVV